MSQITEGDRRVCRKEDVREGEDIKAEGGDDQLVGFKVVKVIKNFETPAKHKYKSRGCATGNWVVGKDDVQVFDEDLYCKPISLLTARALIFR